MAGDNDKDKKGFSGLSDLASEVSGVDEPIKPEPKAETKPSTPEQPPHPQREKPAPEPERKTKKSPPPVETVTSGTNAGGSGGKWILGIIGVAFVIWLINNEGQNNRTSSYNPPSTPQSYGYPQSSPAPAVRAPSSAKNAGNTQSLRLVPTTYSRCRRSAGVSGRAFALRRCGVSLIAMPKSESSTESSTITTAVVGATGIVRVPSRELSVM